MTLSDQRITEIRERWSAWYAGDWYFGEASWPDGDPDESMSQYMTREDMPDLLAEVERLREVELEHTDGCGRFVECGTDGRTCNHAVTLVDDESTQRCVWCLVERQRKVVEAAEEVRKYQGIYGRTVRAAAALVSLRDALDAWGAEQ